MVHKRKFLTTLLITTLLPLMFSGASYADGHVGKEKNMWPEQLSLQPLRQHAVESSPLGADFDYAQAFATLDIEAVKKDIEAVLTESQPWWPADYGHYGPFFIRMAWHSAGTYRISDGRGGGSGGQQRFEPLNSWPDNANLDKARRLLWPIKKKYGRKLSWGDLMILAGNVSLESMGFNTIGFAGGRVDDWEPDLVFWGGPKVLQSNLDKKGKLKKPFGAIQMGLIYVNPQGPNGVPDPLASAKTIRASFGQMAMNDEEIVALVAGGHTFGKAHAAHNPHKCVGPAPNEVGVAQQGFGWKNKCGTGDAADTVTSEFEGAWTSSPIAFTSQYLSNLFNFEWVKTKSPAGGIQWKPANGAGANLVPDAFDSDKRHPPMMLTADLALKADPGFRVIAKRFKDDPDAFADAFARAWFKLTHRDLGPRAGYLGPDAPRQAFLWQDPLPSVDYVLIDQQDAQQLKSEILASGLTVPELVRTAWASASTFRDTDKRGGANGARIRLAPQKDWMVNNPRELEKVLAVLERVRSKFNQVQTGDKQVSLADMIVLGGGAAIEKASRQAGYGVQVPFTPGRVDAVQMQTDVKSFAVLEPTADGFRNYYSEQSLASPAEMLIDKAALLDLNVPQMTALVGGMRALGANADGSKHGILTTRPGVLSNDFFVNLLDMSTQWEKSGKSHGLYEGRDRQTGQHKWVATPVDLVFGANSELRAVAEVYAADDASQTFVDDFVAAWVKVMNLGRL